MTRIANFNAPVVLNVINLIEKKGLKQCVIAENANLTPQALCDAINGRRVLKISEVNAIAKALNVEVSELFKTDESM